MKTVKILLRLRMICKNIIKLRRGAPNVFHIAYENQYDIEVPRQPQHD